MFSLVNVEMMSAMVFEMVTGFNDIGESDQCDGCQ